MKNMCRLFMVVIVIFCLPSCYSSGGNGFEAGTGGSMNHDKLTATGKETAQPAIIVPATVTPPIVTTTTTVHEEFRPNYWGMWHRDRFLPLPAASQPATRPADDYADLIGGFSRDTRTEQRVTPGQLLAPSQVVTPPPLKGDASTKEVHNVNQPAGPAAAAEMNEDAQGHPHDKLPEVYPPPAPRQESGASMGAKLVTPLAWIGYFFLVAGIILFIIKAFPWYPFKNPAVPFICIGAGIGCIIGAVVLTETPVWVYWALAVAGGVIFALEYHFNKTFKAKVDAELASLEGKPPAAPPASAPPAQLGAGAVAASNIPGPVKTAA